MLGNRPDTPAPRLLRVDRSARPGWKTGREQPPGPGQLVYCTEGMAEVIRDVGKTGDGSRLLELRLLEKEAPPFYAAASNVLVMPAEETNGAEAARADFAAPGAPQAAGDGESRLTAAGAVEESDGAADGADAGLAGGDEAPLHGVAWQSAFADHSWALDGSLVPGTAPLPGSAATPERAESAEEGAPQAPEPAALDQASSSTDAAARHDDAAPEGSVAPADDESAADDEPEEASPHDDPFSLLIIGTPHGPPQQTNGADGASTEPGKNPPTFPLDPRVHWIR